MPAHSLLRLIYTIWAFKLGFHVVHSQIKSGQFRSSNQVSLSNSNGYLIMLVLNCELIQLIFFSMHIVKTIWGSMVEKSLVSLVPGESGWFFRDGMKESAAAISKINDVHTTLDFVGCFELFFVFLLHFYKMYRVPLR